LLVWKKGWKVIIHTTDDFPNKKILLLKKEKINGMLIRRHSRKIYPFSVLRRDVYRDGNILVLHDFDIGGHILIYGKVLLMKLIGVKRFTLVFSSHGLFNYGSNVYPGVKVKLRILIQNSLGVWLLNQCVDGIRAVSNFEKQGLIKVGVKIDLISVIGNGLENAAFQPVEKLCSARAKEIVKELGDFVIQVGRIDRVKNFEVAIRSIGKLSDNVKYLIVGGVSDKKYHKELLSLIRDLKLENRVFFTGIVMGADKYYLMKHALAMVHLARAEGYGNVVHEALSQGTICIVSKNTALTELVKRNVNGFHVQMDNHVELSEKISLIVSGKKTAFIKDMKKTNRATHLDNSWEDIASKVETLYETYRVKFDSTIFKKIPSYV